MDGQRLTIGQNGMNDDGHINMLKGFVTFRYHQTLTDENGMDKIDRRIADDTCHYPFIIGM